MTNNKEAYIVGRPNVSKGKSSNLHFCLRRQIFVLLFLFLAATVHAADQMNNAALISAKAGKDVVIKLKSNPTTGYQWQILDKGDKAIIKFIGSKYESEANNKRVGAGGEEIWTFKAMKPGKSKLSFIYIRPWEKNVIPAQERNFLIEIEK